MISRKDCYHNVGSNTSGSIENSEENTFLVNLFLFFYSNFHLNIKLCIFFFIVIYRRSRFNIRGKRSVCFLTL